MGLFSTTSTFELLYRASRDGYDGSAFHSRVDGRGASVSVIKNRQGRVFGGFTDLQQSSEGGTVTGNGNSFQFFINTEGGINQIGWNKAPGEWTEQVFK